MKTTRTKFAWIPRILCILAILFVSIFALDAFAPGLPLWKQLADFGLHLIPSIILTALLIIAWRWELWGGIIFMIVGLGLSPLVYIINYHHNHSVWLSLSIIGMITFPFLLTGILFLFSYRKKNQPTE